MATTAKPKRRPAKKNGKEFYWFQGDSVNQLYQQIGQSGATTARLEVRLSGDKMTFRVVGANQGAASVKDIDDSRRCPPICP